MKIKMNVPFIFCLVCLTLCSCDTNVSHQHIAGSPVEENRVEPTCTHDGSYDLVTYCVEDGTEISRNTLTIPSIGHNLIHHEGKAATCTENGYAAYDTCSRCDYSTFSVIPSTGHKPGTPVEENRVEPTCTKNGSYDLVTYCVEDGIEISRKHYSIKSSGHNYSRVETHSNYDSDGFYTYTCTKCGDVYTEPNGESRLKYKVSWENEDGSLIYEEDYFKGETPIFKADLPSKKGDLYTLSYFDKWEPELTPVTSNISYKAKFSSKENTLTVGQTFDFGCYPQSVATEVTSNLLNDVIPDSEGLYFLHGNYYIKKTANNFKNDYQFHNGNTIEKGKDYYFKIEPIKWKALKNEKGIYTLLTDKLIDANHHYHDSYTGKINGHYASDYENSELRHWLNNDFFNAAFSSLEQESIIETAVDNSSKTTPSPNEFCGNNTIDKVYLLSYKDYKNPDYGFNNGFTDENKICYPTDYAIASGAFVEENGAGFYWTRSPSSDWSYYSYAVFANGAIDEPNYTDYIPYPVYLNAYCERPAITFKSNQVLIDYSIEYDLDGGTIEICNPSSYTIEDEIILNNPTKTGFTFAGWKNSTGNIVTKIEKGTTGNIALTATWNINSYNVVVSCDENKGTVSGGGVYNFNSETTLIANANNGYFFNKWIIDADEYNENPLVYKIKPYDVSITACFNAVDYTIEYDLDGGTIENCNPSSYTIEDEIILNNPSKTGFTFAGWKNSAGNIVTKIEKGTTGNIALTATWNINSYNVVVSCDENKGTVSGGGIYQYNSEVSVNVSVNSGCIFKGWYIGDSSDNIVSKDATYTFKMPNNNLSLNAKIITDEEEEWLINHGVLPSINGNYLTYGMYPQKAVTENTLISVLNTLDSSSANEFGYYYYNNNYYYKMTEAHPMSGYKFDDGTRIEYGECYWFLVEPIKWKILKSENNEYFLTSDVLLDCHNFSTAYSGQQNRTDYLGETGMAYCNNYKFSEIRTWLNTDFYDQAFFLDNGLINITEVDNSPYLTGDLGSKYTCENTFDKVFLLSRKELQTSALGFTSDKARACVTTDYARANGCSVYGADWDETLKTNYYLTRSPEKNERAIIAFDYDGGINGFDVSSKYISVRPAIVISLN